MAFGVLVGQASRISIHLAHEGGKVVTLTHRPSLPPRNILVLIFRGWEDPRAHGAVWRPGKNPQSPGIDPGTLRLVAHCLNHYATPGPGLYCILQNLGLNTHMSNKMQRYTVYFIWKLLYMFRVVPPPIIRSANNCIYSIWYLSDRYSGR